MIQALFTEIAGVYDRMNRLMSLGLDLRWRRLAVAMVSGRPTHILDMACGTGDLSFALAERFTSATVLGVDFTPAMLARARAKNRFDRISFQEGDARRLQAADNSQELVSCAFGFRNFSDKSAALTEARRVLVPDGELLVLEFFKPENRLLGALTSLWLRIISCVFMQEKPSAYAHLRQSIRQTLSVAEFTELARTRGLSLVRRKTFFPCCSCLLFTARPSH